MLSTAADQARLTATKMIVPDPTVDGAFPAPVPVPVPVPCPCSLSLFLSQFQSQLPQFQSRSLSVLSQLPLSQSYSQFLSMLLFHFSAAMAAVAAADQLLVFGVKNVIANKSPDALGLVDGDTTTVAITTPPP